MEAQQCQWWQQLWCLQPLAVTRQAGLAGERGRPAHRLGVQGWLAERAAPQCPRCRVGYGRTGPRVDAGRGPPFVCPISFYRSFPVVFFLAYAFKQLRSLFALLKPEIFDIGTVSA